MAKQYYLPRKDESFITWHDNYTAGMVAHGLALGFTPAEITATQNENILVHAMWNAHQQAKTAAQSATANKDTNFDLVRAHSIRDVKRGKAHPGNTPAISQALGTVGAEDTTDVANAKPTLRLKGPALQGDTKLDFDKSIFDGVIIESKRGNETEWSWLGTDSEPHYQDTRMNLAPGPETRQYRARYLLNDSPVGNWSDILTVTMPG